MAEALQGNLVGGIVVATGDLEELVAGQHQLGHHRHEVFERVHVDADALDLRGSALGFPGGSVRPVLPVGALRGRILGQRHGFELGSGEFGLLRFSHGDGGRFEGERLRQVGTFGFEEGALQIVEGDFAGLELTHDGVGELCLDHGGRRHERGGRHGVEGIDQVVVVSGRLGAGDLEIAEDLP